MEELGGSLKEVKETGTQYEERQYQLTGALRGQAINPPPKGHV